MSASHAVSAAPPRAASKPSAGKPTAGKAGARKPSVGKPGAGKAGGQTAMMAEIDRLLDRVRARGAEIDKRLAELRERLG